MLSILNLFGLLTDTINMCVVMVERVMLLDMATSSNSSLCILSLSGLYRQ